MRMNVCYFWLVGVLVLHAILPGNTCAGEIVLTELLVHFTVNSACCSSASKKTNSANLAAGFTRHNCRMEAGKMPGIGTDRRRDRGHDLP